MSNDPVLRAHRGGIGWLPIPWSARGLRVLILAMLLVHLVVTACTSVPSGRLQSPQARVSKLELTPDGFQIA